MQDQQGKNRHSDGQKNADIVALVGVVAVLAVYVLLRYRGRWGETDTATFTDAIRVVLDTGRLAPGTAGVYPNGYGFQALATFLVHVSGVSLPHLQLYGSALLAVWLVLPAWLAYRELTRSRRGATLAMVILLVQPEFLFPILRGTHEKFTRGLMFLCLYLLFRSIRPRFRSHPFGVFVLTFSISVFALVSFNNLMSLSFSIGLGLALVLSLAVTRFNRSTSGSSGTLFMNLAVATTVSVGLWFLFPAFAYVPARNDIVVLASIMDRLRALSQDVPGVSANPYAVVNTGWISTRVYFVLSLANWMLLLGSATVWILQGARRLWHRKEPSEERELLLWALYGVFALEGAISILVDMSGALAGNLQHRIFPSFAMLAAPLLARWLADWTPRPALVRRLVHTGLWTSVALLAVAAVLKATNEPLLSNKWAFYRPAEMAALDWTARALPRQTVWSGYDERLFSAVRIRSGMARSEPLVDGRLFIGTRNILFSNVIRSRSARLSAPLPVHPDDFITFDDGEAQVLHRRPETPYQK